MSLAAASRYGSKALGLSGGGEGVRRGRVGRKPVTHAGDYDEAAWDAELDRHARLECSRRVLSGRLRFGSLAEMEAWVRRYAAGEIE